MSTVIKGLRYERLKEKSIESLCVLHTGEIKPSLWSSIMDATEDGFIMGGKGEIVAMHQ